MKYRIKQLTKKDVYKHTGMSCILYGVSYALVSYVLRIDFDIDIVFGYTLGMFSAVFIFSNNFSNVNQ